jgi:Domain of unknown function (DUF4277)
MQDIPPAIEVYPVHHLPMITAAADQRGLVGRINHDVPTEMDGDAGTGVLGRVLETRSGRRPLDRLEAVMAHQDPELLLGKAGPAPAFNDAAVGRVLDRLYDRGTMKLVTAGAVRAVPRFGLERRYVHGEPTSRRVWGEDQLAEEQDVPFSVTDGDRKEKRPALTPVVLSMRCVDRAVPIWGKPDAGNASDNTLQTTLVSGSAQLLARHGGQPGASLSIADAALVPEDDLAARGESLGSTRLPAPDSDGERGIAAAVARQPVGGGGRAGPDATDAAPSDAL